MSMLWKRIREATMLIIFYFTTIPSIWILANPLIYIMFFPLGLHYVMTLPWPFLRDTSDPFGRGSSLYFLTYLYADLIKQPLVTFWIAVSVILMLIGTAIFSWRFALWVEDRSALLTKGLYRIFRHPQYLGIIVLILGVSLRTARPISLISWVTMTYAYVLMAYFEEQGLTKKLGEAYLNYKSNTWFMLPFPDALTPKLDNIRTWVKIVIATIILVAYILSIIFFSFGRVVSLR